MVSYIESSVQSCTQRPVTRPFFTIVLHHIFPVGLRPEREIEQVGHKHPKLRNKRT